MNLHENPQDFKDAILATAQHMNISDVFVEKDYWVTFILFRLSQHPELSRIVFKGGTSLSKAYGLIERFSEDIDLALTNINNLSGNKIKTLIDTISKDLTKKPLDEVAADHRNSKGSRFRRTVHKYPRLDLSGEFQSASPDLLLEINSFTKPAPILKKKVRSYIGDFLIKNSAKDVAPYGLDSFQIQVLGLERTYGEKLLGLIRHSYEGPQKVREKIRHLYDIARLEDCPEIEDLKSNSQKFKKLIDIVKETDQASSEFSGNWLNIPFPSAPLFTDPDIKKVLKEAYESSSFKALIWAPEKCPPFKKAWSILNQIAASL